MESVVSTDVAQALASVVDEKPVALGSHEVCIAVNVAGRVEPRKNFVHEFLDLFVGATSPELSNPDRATGCDLARILDVLLEVGGVSRVVIPAQSQWKPFVGIEEYYQWMLMKSMLHPVQVPMKDERYARPFAPLVTAGEPRYIFSLSAF
jgi:hypothetical protein